MNFCKDWLGIVRVSRATKMEVPLFQCCLVIVDADAVVE